MRAMREQAGLTQRQLADLAGVGAWESVSRWEREETTPALDVAVSVALALGTTVDALTGLKEEKPQERPVCPDCNVRTVDVARGATRCLPCSTASRTEQQPKRSVKLFIWDAAGHGIVTMVNGDSREVYTLRRRGNVYVLQCLSMHTNGLMLETPRTVVVVADRASCDCVDYTKHKACRHSAGIMALKKSANI